MRLSSVVCHATTGDWKLLQESQQVVRSVVNKKQTKKQIVAFKFQIKSSPTGDEPVSTAL